MQAAGTVHPSLWNVWRARTADPSAHRPKLRPANEDLFARTPGKAFGAPFAQGDRTARQARKKPCTRFTILQQSFHAAFWDCF